MLNASMAAASLHKFVFSENYVATIGETGSIFVSLNSLTSNPQRIRGCTQRRTVVPVSLIYPVIPQTNIGSSKIEVGNGGYKTGIAQSEKGLEKDCSNESSGVSDCVANSLSSAKKASTVKKRVSLGINGEGVGCEIVSV